MHYNCIMHIQIPLFRATQSVFISAGMPKYNSSQGWKTAAINHTTEPQRFPKRWKCHKPKTCPLFYAVMLLPSESDALTPLVFRFYMFYMLPACSSPSFRRLFAAPAQSAPSTSVNYSACQTNIFTQCEAATDGVEPWVSSAWR